MTQKFSRKIEDFVCERCGKEVQGSGYTNHCPFCLWSKHVDTYPGDRAATCKGLMEPVRIEKDGVGHAIIHRCVLCGYEKRNKTHEKDSIEEMLKIMKENSSTARM